MLPKGFEELVRLCSKERPAKPKTEKDIWDKFLYIVFMGGRRSDPEINIILTILKSLTQLDYVSKTSGEEWRDTAGKAIDERLARIKDEDIAVMLRELKGELFRISASIKGGARFFRSNSITPEKLGELLNGKEKTREFIEGLAENEDVSNVKYTKIIIWLHSLGYADDFCPPSWQTKKFVNDIGPYYPYYEDDKYFMKKAEEIAEEIKKNVKDATTRDVASAIFYYIIFKSTLPPRSPEKKAFDAAMLMKFMKKKKMTLAKISGMLADFGGREKLAESVSEFVHAAVK